MTTKSPDQAAEEYDTRVEKIKKLPYKFVSREDIVTMLAYISFLKSRDTEIAELRYSNDTLGQLLHDNGRDISKLETRIEKLRMGLKSIGGWNKKFAQQVLANDDKEKEWNSK